MPGRRFEARGNGTADQAGNLAHLARAGRLETALPANLPLPTGPGRVHLSFYSVVWLNVSVLESERSTVEELGLAKAKRQETDPSKVWESGVTGNTLDDVDHERA